MPLTQRISFIELLFVIGNVNELRYAHGMDDELLTAYQGNNNNNNGMSRQGILITI